MIITNPYHLAMHSNASSFLMYTLTRNTELEGQYGSQYAERESHNNTFIDKAVLKITAVSNFNGLRMQIYDQNSRQYKVSNEFLSLEFVEANENKPLRIGEMDSKFSVLGSGSNYAMKAYHTVTNQAGSSFQEFLTTQDQEMYLMTHYQQISFKVKARKLSGWGTRIMQSFYLENGTYPIYPQKQKQDVDQGINGINNQGSGAHPFLMMEITGTKQFAGIFLFNSNSMSLEVTFYNGLNQTLNNWASLTFRTTGGMLDFFIFYGPTYQDVMNQYQDVIGKPKILPFWASGFFFKSTSYVKAYNQLLTVKKYREYGFPLSGFVLPSDIYNSYFTNNSNLYIDEIRNSQPDAMALQLILPFTFFMSPNNAQNYSTTIDGKSLAIQLSLGDNVNHSGMCSDVFNPQFQSQYLDPLLFKVKREYFQSYWLENNVPTIQLIDQKQQLDIPYRPGQAFGEQYSLPDQAEHHPYLNESVVNHFNLHSLYGTKMANSFTESLLKEDPSGQQFVFTDSTFPGIGRIGAAVIFQTQSPSYDDLTPTLISMLNYGMFGISNSGPELCNFGSTQLNEDLCLRYFTLSVVSPIAFQFNSYGLILNQNITDIVQLLQKRSYYSLYMRTELKRIDTFGGTLLRPVHTEFPSFIYLTNAIDTLMFGESIMVNFMFHQTATKKFIFFPTECGWLDLETAKVRESYRASESIDFGKSKIKLYQKEGTIIALQNSQSEIVSHKLMLEPLSLSIFANVKERAHGYVYLDNDHQSLQSEMQEIWFDGGVLSFNIIENIQGRVEPAKIGQISMVRILAAKVSYYFEFVLNRDMRTTTKIERSNLFNNILIKDIAFAFTTSMPRYIINQIYRNEDFVIELKLTQNVFNYHIVYFYVELLSNNSLHIVFSNTRVSDKSAPYDIPTQFYDRTFSNVKSKEKSIKLKDVFNIWRLDTNFYFCFRITMPGDLNKVLFDSYNEVGFNSIGYRNIFNFKSEGSSRFFGLGERKSGFFLEDKTTYAFYNNDKNSRPTKLNNGRKIEYGTNGFHPIIYSQINNSTNLTAFILYSGYGTEITYDKLKTGGATFSISSQSKSTEFVYVFNMNPKQTVEAVSEHIKLGELTDNLRENNILPRSAFGYYTTIPERHKNVSEYLEKIKIPLEGILLEDKDLLQSKSFSFDEEKFDSSTLKYVNERNLIVFGLGYTGIPMDGRFDKELNLADIKLRTVNYDPYTRNNRYGKLYYLDFTRPETYLIYKLIDGFSKKWSGNETNITGLSLKQSQKSIDNGPCYSDEESMYFIKPGDQSIQCGTIGMVYRYLGWTEKQVHNLVDLAEQIVYSHAQQVRNNPGPLPLLVQGTALGSGKFPNVMREIDYYTLDEVEIATQQLQALSIFGLSQVSIKYQPVNSSFNSLKEQALLSIYTSALSTYGYEIELEADQITQIRKILCLKYAFNAYIRTNLYIQRINGTPFIRPMFFDFDNVDIDASISQSYMFGPSIIALTSQEYSKQVFPQSNWFSAERISEVRAGFIQYPNSSIDGKQMVFLHQGTITPLYNINIDTFTGANDLMKSPLELHVFTNKVGSSKGSIFMDDSKGQDQCFVEMEMANDTILFSKCNASVALPGYELGNVYLYAYHNLTNGTGYEYALINNSILLELVQLSTDENVATLRIKEVGLSVQLSTISNITFTRVQQLV